MAQAHITEFIVDGNDYFTAYTDANGVRLGLIGCASIDFPAGHAMFAEIVALTDEDAIEHVFDIIVDEYGLV